jgi:hypothetical protein
MPYFIMHKVTHEQSSMQFLTSVGGELGAKIHGICKLKVGMLGMQQMRGLSLQGLSETLLYVV